MSYFDGYSQGSNKRGRGDDDHNGRAKKERHGEHVPENRIVLLTIRNVKYNITTQTLYKVCSPVGKVLRIVIFGRGVFQAMVEFETKEMGVKAMETLDGCDIYSGCCIIRVEYAKTDRLNVKRNDDMTWDFENDFGNSQRQEGSGGKRTLLTEPPQELQRESFGRENAGMGGMGGGMGGMGGGMGGAMGGMGGGMGGMGGNMGGTSGGMGGMGGGMSGTGGGMGGMGSGMGGGMSGGMRGMDGGMGGGMRGMGNDMRRSMGRDDMRGSMGRNMRGDMGDNRMGNSGWENERGMGGGYGAQGCVLIAYGLETDKMTCERVFNLFCQYGNILRVNFVKSGRAAGSVMIEMSDPDAVDRVMANIKNFTLFGSQVRLDYSKAEFIGHIKNPVTCCDGSPGFVDFEGCRKNRFDTPDRAAKNRIVPPTKTLHFYNVPKMEDDDFRELFAQQGAVRPLSVKWLPYKNERSVSGIVEFDDIVEASEALVLINHMKIEGDDPRRPYDMKLCFSPKYNH